jgi:hypothetical protein
MRRGAERVRLRKWFFGFGLGLLACGGRTLDDGVYGYMSNGSTCSYGGKVYSDGTLVPEGSCVCFCDQNQIECEQGCSNSSGASNGGGAAVGSGGTSSGGTSSGGTSSGGTTGSSGATTGGVATGGSSGVGGASAGTGGVSTAGSVGTGGVATGGSGGTGGVSTAGSAGVGGTVSSCGPAPRATGSNSLIDSMEDNDPYISPLEGRGGVWFTYNDATAGGFQIPFSTMFYMTNVLADASGGRFVANTLGRGFGSWGAGMGFVLNEGCPYDAQIYQGLHFFVRAEYGISSLLALVPTAATTPTTNRGACVPTLPTSCYDDFQTTLLVGPDWTEEHVPFSQLEQMGFGTPVAFDPTTLMGVNFQTEYGDGESFSFSIDDISFY